MAAYGLTEREQEVTRLVLQGGSMAEIADRLCLSPHTAPGIPGARTSPDQI